jgi:uncharacterized Zn-finger protein
MYTKLFFSSKIRINRTVYSINHKIFLSNFKSYCFSNLWNHISILWTKNTLLPLCFFMTVHLRNVTNSRLTGSLCRPEFFRILFLPIDNLLKCTVSTASVIYHRTHLADIRTVSLLSVFNVSAVFIYLFIPSVMILFVWYIFNIITHS